MSDLWPLRDLQLSDLKEMQEDLPKEPVVAKLRDGHHNLARLLAEGRKDVEVSAITGYSQVHICRLKSDPMFQELVGFYRTQVQGVFLDAHQRLATLGTTAVQVLQERLENEGDEMAIGVLVKVAEMALDRSVAPKKSLEGQQRGGNVPQININFVPSNTSSGPIIEAQVIENN